MDNSVDEPRHAPGKPRQDVRATPPAYACALNKSLFKQGVANLPRRVSTRFATIAMANCHCAQQHLPSAAVGSRWALVRRKSVNHATKYCNQVSDVSSTRPEQHALTHCPGSNLFNYPHVLWISLWMDVSRGPGKPVMARFRIPRRDSRRSCVMQLNQSHTFIRLDHVDKTETNLSLRVKRSTRPRKGASSSISKAWRSSLAL